jgi:hypothetical protein
MRNVYGLGFQLNTTGNDSNALFDYFLIAYGGKDIVTKDGKLHVDDPQVREAAIKAVTYPTTAYKEGFVPPGAINWNDADDNNAFHARQIIMDLDGTLSTEVAMINKKQDYEDIETMGLALSNDGKPVPSEALHTGGLIPQGAKNVEVAKDFLKFLIQPEVLNAYLKAGLGRNIPCMPSTAKNDPWWLADPHRAAYTRQAARPQCAEFLGIQPGLRQRREHTCVAHGLGRRDQRRHDAASGRRKGVQTSRGDLCKVPNRAKLRSVRVRSATMGVLKALNPQGSWPGPGSSIGSHRPGCVRVEPSGANALCRGDPIALPARFTPSAARC